MQCPRRRIWIYPKVFVYVSAVYWYNFNCPLKIIWLNLHWGIAKLPLNFPSHHFLTFKAIKSRCFFSVNPYIENGQQTEFLMIQWSEIKMSEVTTFLLCVFSAELLKWKSNGQSESSRGCNTKNWDSNWHQLWYFKNFTV